MTRFSGQSSPRHFGFRIWVGNVNPNPRTLNLNAVSQCDAQMLLQCGGPPDDVPPEHCREHFQGGALLEVTSATASVKVAAAGEAMSRLLYSSAAAALGPDCAPAAGPDEADAWPAPGATLNQILEQMHEALPDMGGPQDLGLAHSASMPCDIGAVWLYKWSRP